MLITNYEKNPSTLTPKIDIKIVPRVSKQSLQFPMNILINSEPPNSSKDQYYEHNEDTEKAGY